MEGDNSQRLTQENQCDQVAVCGLMEQAESVSQGVLESIQTLAGTTSCKGVQIARLREWAKLNHCWIDNVDTLGTFEDRGSENEVYMSSTDENIVYKLNDFRYSDDNLIPFFERIKAHNMYFPDCAYGLVGFAKNRIGKTCAVLSQPFILSGREATEKEISDELRHLGFDSQMDGEYFTNGIHDIFDAVPNNVLVGIDGNLYFIDTIIYKSSDSNVNTYRSQSPQFMDSIYR